MTNRRDCPVRILVAGGTSRAAIAFRELLKGNADIEATFMVRQMGDTATREKTSLVADYFDPPSKLLSQADVVVNFAGVTKGISDADFSGPNVSGPTQLALRAREAGAHHFIHLSSLSIYGYAPYIDRRTIEAPLSPYGRSKQLADKALAELETDDFKVALLRAPVIYGIGGKTKLHLLATAMKKLGCFPAPRARGRRSVLHRTNLARAILAVAQSRLGGKQFAADPEPFTLDAMAQVASEGRARPVKIVTIPNGFFTALRICSPSSYFSLYGDSQIAQSACVDLSKLNATPLREGLKDLLR